MKNWLRFGGALALIVVVCLVISYVRYVRDAAARCDTLTLSGEINTATFTEARDCLVRSTAAKKTFVVTTSGGGNGEVALALGKLIHEHNWDVEIVDFCASSCANFIFPAGRVKYLHKNALLMFHGGLHQKNLQELVLGAERTVVMDRGAVGEVGQVDKEAHIDYGPTIAEASREVREFLSIRPDGSAAEILNRMIGLSDEFYRQLGVNPLLPEYGQTGRYEPVYESYKSFGFMYGLDSLGRLGISNVELKDGEWHPEGNPLYEKFYEVTYP